MADWRIKKEQIWLREEVRWSRPGWSLYYEGKRMARYGRWSLALDHIERVYKRWPDFGKVYR